jgi:hypothetical protein
MEFAGQRGRQPSFVECVERLARGQLGGAAQTTDAALVSLVRFELEHFEQER